MEKIWKVNLKKKEVRLKELLKKYFRLQKQWKMKTVIGKEKMKVRKSVVFERFHWLNYFKKKIVGILEKSCIQFETYSLRNLHVSLDWATQIYVWEECSQIVETTTTKNCQYLRVHNKCIVWRSPKTVICLFIFKCYLDFT